MFSLQLQKPQKYLEIFSKSKILLFILDFNLLIRCLLIKRMLKTDSKTRADSSELKSIIEDTLNS
jgi:hypothetical protein